MLESCRMQTLKIKIYVHLFAPSSVSAHETRHFIELKPGVKPARQFGHAKQIIAIPAIINFLRN